MVIICHAKFTPPKWVNPVLKNSQENVWDTKDNMMNLVKCEIYFTIVNKHGCETVGSGIKGPTIN